MADIIISLEKAKAELERGGVILYPTETFFAIGCNAMNPDAIGKVYTIKKRGLDLPLPVVIGDTSDISRLAWNVPPLAQKLMDVFWPGSLSIILPALPEIPDLLLANAGRIAVRHSPHPAVKNLCRETGMVLVSSSANITGSMPPATLDDICPELLACTGGVYMDGPFPDGGLPSTIVDVIEEAGETMVRILREGRVSEEEIENAGFTVSKRERNKTAT